MLEQLPHVAVRRPSASHRGRWVLVWFGVLGLGVSRGVVLRAADPNPRPAEQRRPAIVDQDVTPAGGCRGCREPHCPRCRGLHHAGCRNGLCHPHCPVRPQEFGFYGTQWRRWPRQGVVPAGLEVPATPAVPPRSAVPKVNEESLLPTPEAADGTDGIDRDRRGPDRGGRGVRPDDGAAPEPPVAEPARLTPDAPAKPAVEPRPKDETPAPTEQQPAPPSRARDADPFDQSSAVPARRGFPTAKPLGVEPGSERPVRGVQAVVTAPLSTGEPVVTPAAGWSRFSKRIPLPPATGRSGD